MLLKRITYFLKEWANYIVGDDHGLNNKLIQLLLVRLYKKGINLSYEVTEHRIRYYSYMVNLAVQAFLFCETKEAVELTYQLAKECLKDDGKIKLKAIEELLAKVFKNVDGKLKKKLMCAIGALSKLYNFVSYARSSNAYYNRFVN